MDTVALRKNLRQALLEYRERRPNLSLRAIARNSGVNRYFLNKLLDDVNEHDQSPLDLNQVLLFLKFMTKKATVGEIVDAANGEVKSLLSAAFHTPFRGSVAHEATGKVNLYDYHTYFIMHFAAFDQGIKRDMIEKILGESASKSLAVLLDRKVVEEVDGKIRLCEGKDFTYLPDVMKHHFGNYSRFFDPDHIGQKRNYISVISQSVNRDALAKIQEVYIEAFKKVDHIVRDAKNWGDLPAFAISCVDTFVDEIDKVEEESSENLGLVEEGQVGS